MRSFPRGFALLAILTLISTTSCGQLAATTVPTVALTPTVAPTATTVPALIPSDPERKLTVDGLERSYLLHIPPDLDMAHPVPVVFAFHGAGDQPSAMELSAGWKDIADKNGFVLLYPIGVGQTWNVGGCCGYAAQKNINEAAFIRQILSDLGTIFNVNSKRIYATGISNGAGMVYRLACEMSDTFAAVASVAGGLIPNPCQPAQPISIMEVHGLSDSVLPYTGGGEFKTPPIEELMRTWAQRNGCSGSPQVDKQKVFTHTVYTSCKDGTTVELYAIEGGGHAWPSKNVWDASQAIWKFFVAHPKL